jgi:NAD dependent epimerase/dehydratase family enzyme
MGSIVTTGQRVVPSRLLEAGFEFRQPAIEPALRDILN